MLRQGKAPSGVARGGGITTAGSLVTPNYTPKEAQLQAPFRPWISGPLDLAIAQIEHHRALARFHYAELCRHKLIKVELEKLVFGGES